MFVTVYDWLAKPRPAHCGHSRPTVARNIRWKILEINNPHLKKNPNFCCSLLLVIGLLYYQLGLLVPWV